MILNITLIHLINLAAASVKAAPISLGGGDKREGKLSGICYN